MDSTDDRMIVLISKDGDKYDVPRKVGVMSNLVEQTLGDDEEEEQDADNMEATEIPLPNVSSAVLQKVIEYCTHYQQVETMTSIQAPLRSNKLSDLVQEWYADYVNQMDKDLLFELVSAANFMDIKQLLDLTCLAVAILIKGKSATELRQMFNISHELSPEEQAQIQRDNAQFTTTTEQQEQEQETTDPTTGEITTTTDP